MSASAKERVDWYVKRVKLAAEALQEAFPDMTPEARTDHAVRIACAEGIVDELESITSAINNIE